MDGSKFRNVPGNEMPDKADYVRNSSPLDESLLHMEKTINSLDEAVECLFHKTDPIRANNSEPTQGEPNKPESTMRHSTVVENIDAKTEHIHSMVRQIRTIIDQLEV